MHTNLKIAYNMFFRNDNVCNNVIFQHPVALYRSDLEAFVPSMSFFVSLYWTLHVSA
jgi:hypothetical protein